MLEIWCIGCIVVMVIFFAKEGWDKAPSGCLVVAAIFLVLFIKACNDMEQEEKERQNITRKGGCNIIECSH